MSCSVEEPPQRLKRRRSQPSTESMKKLKKPRRESRFDILLDELTRFGKVCSMATQFFKEMLGGSISLKELRAVSDDGEVNPDDYFLVFAGVHDFHLDLERLHGKTLDVPEVSRLIWLMNDIHINRENVTLNF